MFVLSIQYFDQHANRHWKIVCVLILTEWSWSYLIHHGLFGQTNWPHDLNWIVRLVVTLKPKLNVNTVICWRTVQFNWIVVWFVLLLPSNFTAKRRLMYYAISLSYTVQYFEKLLSPSIWLIRLWKPAAEQHIFILGRAWQRDEDNSVVATNCFVK